MALMILPSSRRDSLTSSSWPCRNSWRSWSASNSSRASGLIGPMIRSSRSSSRIAGRRRGARRPAAGTRWPWARSGSQSRSRRSASTVVSMRSLVSASSISRRCSTLAHLAQAAARPRPARGGGCRARPPPARAASLWRRRRSRRPPSSVSITPWRSATSAVRRSVASWRWSSSTRRSSAAARCSAAPGQALLDLAQPALQELAALAHPGAADLEVGAQGARPRRPAPRAGPGPRPWPALARPSRARPPRAPGSSASRSATRSCSRSTRPASSSRWACRASCLGGDVATLGLDPLRPSPAAAHAAVVGVELAGQVVLGPAGLGRRAWSASASRAAATATAASAAGGSLAGLVEGGAGGAGAGGPDPPARRPEAVAVGVDDHGASGWARATSTRLGPAARRPRRPRRPARRAARRPRGAGRGDGRGPHVAAHRLAHRRRRRRRPPGRQGQHRAGEGLGVQGASRDRRAASTPSTTTAASASPAAASKAASQPASISTRSSQGAEHAVGAGQPLGAGPAAGLVEGHGQRFGPGQPGVVLGLGCAVGGLGLGPRRLGLGPPLLGPVEGLDQRELGLLGRGDLDPQALGLVGQAGGLVGQAVEAGPHPGQLGLAPLDARPQGRQLAAHLGGLRCWRRGHAVGPLGLVAAALARPAPPRPRPAPGAAGPAPRPRRRPRRSSAPSRAASASRVAMTPWSTKALRSRSMPRRRSASSERQAPGPLEQRLELGQRVAQVVAAHGRQPGLGGHDRACRARPARRSSARSVLVQLDRRWAAAGSSRARSAASSRPATWMRSACSSATTSPWRRAASAWRSRGRSWRRTSRSRSCRRVRLPSVASRRRSLFSLRRRYFEHAGRLFDDAAAVLGAGVEHRVDLALADDHVLLAADAAVAQQLLHVEQPAGHAVDGVLAVAAAEQRAGDGDLGELDRQHARGVVDRERHLGPAQRAALGGAGEDDVVHLLGAHRAGRLGPEHPADGVDHVGLAAAVGSDHHRHARVRGRGRWCRRTT